MYKISQDPKDTYCGLVGNRDIKEWPSDVQYIVVTMRTIWTPAYDSNDSDSTSPCVDVERVFTSTEQLKAWAERNVKELDKYRIFEVKREIKLKPVVTIQAS